MNINIFDISKMIGKNSKQKIKMQYSKHKPNGQLR